MFPLLQLGPVAFPVSGLVLIISMWIALNVAEREARRQRHSPEWVYGLTISAFVAGVLGARLWYVGRYLDAFLADPLSIVVPNSSTLDMTGGLIFGLLAAFFFAVRKKLLLRPTLDILVPGMAFFAMGLGLAHLASGEAFGTPTDLPWAIELWDARRHPVQIYEMILAATVFLLVWRVRKSNPFPGFLFLIFVALTVISRLLLEIFRGDSIIVAGGIRQEQLVALAVLLFTLWLMRQWYSALINSE